MIVHKLSPLFALNESTDLKKVVYIPSSQVGTRFFKFASTRAVFLPNEAHYYGPADVWHVVLVDQVEK